jgi:hypothetical protein
MKILLATIVITMSSVIPVHANTMPNLRGYTCIDQRGIHHSWHAVFEGVYCTLVINKR